MPIYFDSTDTDKGMEMSRHFARFMVKLAGEDIPGLYLAAGLVSWYTSQGHVCLDLSRVAGKPQAEVWNKGDGYEPFPPFDNWIEALRRAPVVGQPGDFKPLVLDESGRLYLYRYWEYEQIIAKGLLARVTEPCGPLDMALLEDGLTRLFPDSDRKGDVPWPKIAALTAVSRRFCVISGGPGTGKTSTVVKVLVLLLEQAGGGALRIALAAPTGKAAGRLKESIRTAKRDLACLPEIRQLIPEDVSTIHRLLGPIRGSARFHYHEENPLPYDVVVIDEASMVDLPLMAKLVQALPEKAQLILLGDKDQLASVEAGAVLGDICDTGRAHPYSPEFVEMAAHLTGGRPEEANDPAQKSGLHDSIVLLRKSYRFGEGSGIGLVSQAVNAGEGQKSLDLFKNPSRHSGKAGRDISWRLCPSPPALAETLAHLIIQEYSSYLKADSPDEAFQLFHQFRILCALRRGPYGVAEVNTLAERVLRRNGLIRSHGRWHQGQPIMITRNDYQLGFFNGDVGLILPDPAANGDLRVFFPSSDGIMRKILPGRLPEYETVYAMTVHKSQGSEFDRVLLLLPDRDAEILTRELIYTGITRARESVEVWGREEVFLKAVTRSIERQSGLRDLLWK